MAAQDSSSWPEGKPPANQEEFLRCLDASGVLGSAAALQLLGSSAESPEAPETLAKTLLRSGKLTRLQAKAILAGKVKHLTLGEYSILEKLGQGGMGTVYKAEHRRMKRTVALKVIAGAALKQADAERRFSREVEAAARLLHPNIVTAFDANECKGIHFFVMEYVAGRDLNSVLAEQGALAPSVAVDFVLQAARGLAYAHRQGVVHRDVKPGNLLVDRQGVVKILDLGLARIRRTHADSGELTNTGQVMGTIDYMAPEQAEDTRSADARADIYSLGCTLYRLLHGQPVYGGDTVVRKLIAHREAAIPSLTSGLTLSGTEPLDALDRTFRRMVAKHPNDRHASMDEVVTELESWQSGRSRENVSLAAAEPTTDFTPSQSRAIGLKLQLAEPVSRVGRPPPKPEVDADRTLNVATSDTSPSLAPRSANGATISSDAASGFAIVPRGRAKRSTAKLPRSTIVALGVATSLALLAGIAWALINSQGRPLEATAGKGARGPKVIAAPSKAAEPNPIPKAVVDPAVELAAKMARMPAPEIDGNWQLKDGALTVPVKAPTRMFYLRFGDPGWTDYDLQAKVKVHDRWPSEFGLLTRCEGDARWQYIVGGFANMSNRDLLACKPNDDAWHNAARRYTSGQPKVEPGSTHVIKLRVRGPRATTYFDGEEIAWSEDKGIARGRAGLCMFGHSHFIEIEVRGIDGTLLWNGLPSLEASAAPANDSAGN